MTNENIIKWLAAHGNDYKVVHGQVLGNYMLAFAPHEEYLDLTGCTLDELRLFLGY